MKFYCILNHRHYSVLFLSVQIKEKLLYMATPTTFYPSIACHYL